MAAERPRVTIFASKVAECHGGQGNFGCGGEIDDCFEGFPFASFCLLDFSEAEFVQAREHVLDRSTFNKPLRDFLVRRNFIL